MVPLGWCSTGLETGWLKNKFISHSCSSVKSEIRLLAWTGSAEDLLTDSYHEFSLFFLPFFTRQKAERKAVLSRYLEGHWSHHGATSSWPHLILITSQKLSMTSTYEFWRNIYVQFITWSICKDFDRTIL